MTELASQQPGAETQLADVFHQIASRIQRRGIVMILSDLFGNVEQLMKALAHFRHARHEVVIFQIWDPDELDFPFRQWTQFASLENSAQRHLVDPAQLRKAYLQKLQEYRDQLAQGCSRNRIALVPLVTNQPSADALAAWLAIRRRTR
jgi:uncharacterized protein (DUF58 family)